MGHRLRDKANVEISIAEIYWPDHQTEEKKISHPQILNISRSHSRNLRPGMICTITSLEILNLLEIQPRYVYAYFFPKHFWATLQNKLYFCSIFDFDEIHMYVTFCFVIYIQVTMFSLCQLEQLYISSYAVSDGQQEQVPLIMYITDSLKPTFPNKQ